MAEVIDLGDLTPTSQDVKFKNKDGGVERFVVREASVPAATAYRNARSRASRYENGSFVGVDGMADCEPLLVSMCVFRVDDKGGASPAPVGLATVNGWPDRVQRGLFDIVKEISPRLLERPSLEAIAKQIAALEEQREEILAEQRGKPSPNAPAPPTGGTSDSAGN